MCVKASISSSHCSSQSDNVPGVKESTNSLSVLELVSILALSKEKIPTFLNHICSISASKSSGNVINIYKFIRIVRLIACLYMGMKCVRNNMAAMRTLLLYNKNKL